MKILGSGRTFSDIELAGNTLRSCVLAQFDDPEFGLEVRNVVVDRCAVERVSVQGVYFDNVTVNELKTKQSPSLYGCVLSRVVLKGKIGPIMVGPPTPTLPNRDRHVTGMVEKYHQVEWALDISEASFTDASFFGVPGELVRYDPETQVLLKREKFQGIQPEDLPGFAGIWASRFTLTPFDSFVAVAPKRSKKFPEYMRDIEWLHDQGMIG
ncbi:hypothetical protein [Streptomyces sp. TLI_146]|uniref:hypothetical protein n=1 Tax=Streptomyces sp. TLI_146 TaxID=1938858 RepID=UPI00117E168C|nr:hypothetical protein [Streptomyces sp. TLI_146]